MNDGFMTISQYVNSPESLRDRIIRIDNLILSMEAKLLESVDSANYQEYQMDDGQMKVRTVYRSVKDVTAGILSLEQIKQRYINRLNGSVTVLRSGNL